ncbi:ricin-type beta-trefoil lectin domain protein [Micromonospora fiedleri]|uniref:Ricin-type beta-trefoil lectin domain protein n=1 Tax=Micromonospora fiedleri TaxID=1157498 RepID=A0ABS1UXM9_9ACTN|nr:ricin-type beta-trefoil lectin domain protein [Micromonospora fiedleri]MBL6279655.1 ricin-type beta-trefoil lectin domain protein [Micromonospora fiedleri]
MTVSTGLFPGGKARLGGRIALLTILTLALGLVVVMSSRSDAVVGERVTFVNSTGETLWIGAGESADGSRPITGLPVLRPGESATIVIPDDGRPGHWRGRFFARQRCSGEPGSTFRCLVGDCGVHPDRCERGAEPVSLAEFNFDQHNSGAPWYNVSYVDALSLTITIETPGGPPAPVAGTCVRWDCSGGQLLAACPEAHAVIDPQRGDRINCVNPERDSESAYTAALRPFGPRAYLWSTHDRVPGNETVLSCPGCADFVVTFRGGGTPVRRTVEQPAGSPASTFALRGYQGKCVDVPGGISADGAGLQLWRCNDSPAQRFSHGPNGSLMALDKCMDVAWASRDNGAKVQLAHCNGGPAQVWVVEAGMLRNPHSGRCVDVRGGNTADGAALQTWECAPGRANQTWRPVGR